VFCQTDFEAAIEAQLARIRDLTLPPYLPKLVLQWGDGETKTLAAHLNEKRIFPKRPQYDFVKVMAEQRYFAAMATQHRWQNTLLSMRARLLRVPDSYNTIATILFCSAVSNIREAMIAALTIRRERTTIHYHGGDYTIDRFCPHQGADLALGRIDEPGLLVCPRHSWRFDLSKGGKCPANGYTINAVRAERSEADRAAFGRRPASVRGDAANFLPIGLD
jgi:UDP-MurNAc hydroxylase